MNGSEYPVKIYIIPCAERSVYTSDDIYESLQAGDVDDAAEFIARFGEDSDVIGIMSCGRYLVRNNQPLDRYYITGILNGKKFDLIMPLETSADSGRKFAPGCFICRRGLLRAYLLSQSDDSDDRWGAGFKRWILSEGYRVKAESISAEDPDIWNAGYKKIGLVQNYIDAVLKEYITLRETSGFETDFAGDNPYDGDFGGRKPVWICWWQGIDDAPELIRACIESIKRNIPEYAVPVLITLDNWEDYVTFTDAVIDKFNKGIITYTHLSDILRAELLYRYGGLWIDTTYYVSQRIPERVMNGELYSVSFDPPLWGMDIMRGRWTLSLLAGSPRREEFQFLMEGLWLYWENSDELVDYFLVDYVMDVGYRHIDVIKKHFDMIPLSPPEVYDLQLKMNQRISGRDVKWLRSASVFYKINRRNEYKKTTFRGDMTFFGYITEGSAGLPDSDGKNSVKPVVITYSSEGELINSIREINPYRILDRSAYFYRSDCISRGMLDDIIGHELIIDCATDDADAVGRSIYDSVMKPDALTDDMIGSYDAVIEA